MELGILFYSANMLDHFTVVRVVSWPWNKSEAGDDFALIPHCFSYVSSY